MRPSTAPNDDRIVDWDKALDRVEESPEILQELVDIFLDEWPRMMDEIEEGIARQDHATLRRAAHTLKGSAAIFGAQPVTEAANTLTEMAKREQLDAAEQPLRELQDQMERLVPELKAGFDGAGRPR